ncbi:hypothetical protein [Desulforhopalus singaporensis]|uniref:hypothetical protein n=1 Tax=Desulforhopalus singaporensis TaxID=91360 RepID=UPI00115F9DA0|nr:hypothetical protein [Desulforhopalus singaporensis]
MYNTFVTDITPQTGLLRQEGLYCQVLETVAGKPVAGSKKKLEKAVTFLPSAQRLSQNCHKNNCLRMSTVIRFRLFLKTALDVAGCCPEADVYMQRYKFFLTGVGKRSGL